MNRNQFIATVSDDPVTAPLRSRARFAIGDVVTHKTHDFRGVVFDIDPVYANSDEWYEAIPEGKRPRKDQPFYHLLAENEESSYVAYVSQQNLLMDREGEEVEHPQVSQLFEAFRGGKYHLRRSLTH